MKQEEKKGGKVGVRKEKKRKEKRERERAHRGQKELRLLLHRECTPPSGIFRNSLQITHN